MWIKNPNEAPVLDNALTLFITGLVLAKKDDNLDEYWEGDELKYECLDPTLGTDASADNFKIYKCKR